MPKERGPSPERVVDSENARLRRRVEPATVGLRLNQHRQLRVDWERCRGGVNASCQPFTDWFGHLCGAGRQSRRQCRTAASEQRSRRRAQEAGRQSFRSAQQRRGMRGLLARPTWGGQESGLRGFGRGPFLLSGRPACRAGTAPSVSLPSPVSLLPPDQRATDHTRDGGQTT